MRDKLLLISLGMFAAMFSWTAAKGATGAAGNKSRTFQSCTNCPFMIRIDSLLPESRNLYVSIHELTWKNYLRAYSDGECRFPVVYIKLHGVSEKKAADQLKIDWPIARLSIADINCYLSWINRNGDIVYRLPTSAEWDYFARAGVNTKFPWGNDIGRNNAAIWEAFDSERLASRSSLMSLNSYVSYQKVGQFPPNNFGLYDVIGNAEELTQTCVGDPPNARSLDRDPDRACNLTMRGGSWTSKPSEVGLSNLREVSSRSDLGPVGIRLVAEDKPNAH